MGRNDFISEIFHFSSERKKAASAVTHEESIRLVRFSLMPYPNYSGSERCIRAGYRGSHTPCRKGHIIVSHGEGVRQ